MFCLSSKTETASASVFVCNLEIIFQSVEVSSDEILLEDHKRAMEIGDRAMPRFCGVQMLPPGPTHLPLQHPKMPFSTMQGGKMKCDSKSAWVSRAAFLESMRHYYK